jgi:hypothetical protein
VADVDQRAGIREGAEDYARRAADAIVKRASAIFTHGYEIIRQNRTDLREHLQRGVEDYNSLCSVWQARILVLGDFQISKSWSTIDSAYWPDYHIHLHNCESRRSRREVYKHLNPSNRDRFPFEEAVTEKTGKFLSDSRWVVEN